MKNYSIEVKAAKMNESGFSAQAGWITVYQVHPVSREYIGANYEYLPVGVGIPADSYIDIPEIPPADLALRRSNDGLKWEHVLDYRDQSAYSKETRQAQVVRQLGELPDNMTLLKPATEFDKWDGNTWVTDADAQRAAAVKIAQQELASRKSVASSRINELTYAINLDIATDEEKTALLEWKKYVVLLSRIDIYSVDISWPNSPNL
ncbi:tail fiber assembly protein [Pectobacterium sp. CHL-2024]|uniref:tail fiber assembly protein n=1 Tax=Pectobacterium sp. CHL-2024 TaxID=3377079 RepID=UPI0038164BBB